MGEAKYMVSWPAGRPGFSIKRLPGGSAGLIRAALFFEKPGRPAGQLIILIILIILINQSILFLKPESNPFPETGVGGGVGGPLRVGGPFSMISMVNMINMVNMVNMVSMISMIICKEGSGTLWSGPCDQVLTVISSVLFRTPGALIKKILNSDEGTLIFLF